MLLILLLLQTLSVTVPVNQEFQVSFDLEQDTTRTTTNALARVDTLSLSASSRTALTDTGDSQTLSVTIEPNKPFTMFWDHDGLLMPDFRAWCDGAIVKNFSAMDAKPSATQTAEGRYTYSIQVPGLPAGTHTCWFTAFNQNGEYKACGAGQTSTEAVPCVTPITFPVGVPAPVGKPPAVPVNIRIGVGGGSW